MSTPKRKSTTDKTRQQVSDEVALFLKDGGKIKQIDSGISGQKERSGPQQIVLGKQPDR